MNNSVRPGLVVLVLALWAVLHVCDAGAGEVAVKAKAPVRDTSDVVAVLQNRVEQLERRLGIQEDIEAIDRLTKSYGFYVSAQDWDSIIDLFSADSSVEIAMRGVYLGRKGVETVFKRLMSLPQGLHHGDLFNHMQLQGIVNVDPGRKTANARYFMFAQNALPRPDGSRLAMWGFGIYENDYVKEGGIWKFKKMHWYMQVGTPYEDGWTKTSFPPSGIRAQYPPDLPPSAEIKSYPDVYVPPYRFPHPVTGK
jgi:hypothetical protein